MPDQEQTKMDAVADWCLKFSKIILLVINVTFMLLGIGLVVVGSYAIEKDEQLQEQTQLLAALDVKQFGVGILVVGIVIFITALVGFIGAWKKNRLLLTIYAIVLLCVIIAQLVIGFVVYRFNDRVDAKIDELLQDQWQNEANLEQKRNLQDFLKCCGYADPDDAPVSPCSYTIGCKEAAIDFISQYSTPIAVSAIVFACVQVCAMIFSCCMLCQAKKRDMDELYFLN